MSETIHTKGTPFTKSLLPIGLSAAFVLAACPTIPEITDAGPHSTHQDASSAIDGSLQDSGNDHDGRSNDAAQHCGPGTPFYGEPCGDCGLYICDMEDNLICYDEGFNLCGVCGDLDQSAGRLDSECGSCGLVACSEDGLSSLCQGEHPHNICGGCEVISGSSPDDALDGGADADAGAGQDEDAARLSDAGLPILRRGPPGTSCSSCGTGEWRCSADLNDLVCYHGRGQTACGSCDRCVLASAAMDQRFSGNYLRAGTMAIIEDTGSDLDTASDVAAGTNRALVFDPLVTGPGASALAMAYVFLSPSLDVNDANAFMLSPEFAASSSALLSDDTRRYIVYPWLNLEDFNYVIVYDYFLEQSISVGELQMGATVPLEDAGFSDGAVVTDASISDAAQSGTDASVTDISSRDLSTSDQQIFDVISGDSAVHDAHWPDTLSTEDSGLDANLDAGPEDAEAQDLLQEDHFSEDSSALDVRVEDIL